RPWPLCRCRKIPLLQWRYAMKDTTSRAEVPGVDEFATRLAELGKRRIDTISKAQEQMLDALQDWNRDCLAHAKAETMVASSAVSKLMEARSFPEAASAYQQWLIERADMIGEENQHFIADGQKLIEANWRFLAGNWSGRSP